MPQVGGECRALLGKSGLDVVRQLACGLADHGEVPQQGVAALAIGFQVADGKRRE